MYCVYLTLYLGSLLPKRYIGSSSIERVKLGYNGSVKSKKYKMLYDTEQVENKHLFKTRILSIHDSIEAAQMAELSLQIKYNVVKSALYMNMSYASPNGCFGRDISGVSHPMYGKKLSKESRKSISDTLKLRYASGSLTSPFKYMNTAGENNPFFGKKHSEETKEKMRKPKALVPKYQCPHCDKIYDRGNLFQHMKRNGFSQDQADLIKPEGWTAPSHRGNHFLISKL